MDTLHPWRDIRPWKKHSLALLVAGMVYITVGSSFFFGTLTPENKLGLHLALQWFDIQVWGVIFVLAGILAIVSSRWPPVSETWGYTVLTSLSVGWAMTYLTGILFFDAPMNMLRGVVTWGLLGFLWWIISGLRNPDDAERVLAQAKALKRENDALYLEIENLKHGRE